MRKNKWKLVLTGATSVAMALSMSAVSFAEGGETGTFSTWKTLYSELLGQEVSVEEGYYDTVTSATGIKPNHHYGHIPSVINKDEKKGFVHGEEKDIAELNGVNLKNVEKTKEVKLGSTEWNDFKTASLNKKYGTDELLIYPDDKVEGYVWSEYLDKIYAVTVSDGTTTVGALPWIDFYGEKATAGPHYNKIEVALNSGKVATSGDRSSTEATVRRFDAFYENGVVKPGTYTVRVYAEGYKDLVADVKVPTRTDAIVRVEDVTAGSTAAALHFTGLPEDYEPVIAVDGNTVLVTGNAFDASSLKIGSHSVTVTDGKDKYQKLATTFLVKTDKVPAQFRATKLVAAEGASEEAFAGYLKGISSVKVGERTYAATGRGAKVVIKEDGSIDLSQTLSVQTTGKIDFVVTAPGYPELTFTVTAKDGVVVEPETPRPTKPASTVKKPVAKKANPMTVSGVNKTYKAKKLKKKAQSFTAITVKKSQGKVSMTVKPVNAKAKKALKFNKGKITVARKTKKGTYQMKVTVKAAGNSAYNVKTVVKTITVKVK